MRMAGTLFGVGVGPGETELMSLKAERKICECDVIVFPNKDKEKCMAYGIAEKLLDSLAAEKSPKKCVFLNFPMTKDSSAVLAAKQAAATTICGYLEQNLDVAFLTVGDPAVYSTFMHISAFVEQKGFKIEIVSGVTSFCAAAARLGITLAEPDEPIHIIPGSYSMEKAFDLEGTFIFMKSGSRLAELKQFLLKQKTENHIDFDFYAVSNCGLENEKICRDLASFDADSGYMTVVIVKNRKAQKGAHYKFFQNRMCEMFPCHKDPDGLSEENFNCLFCYCPLYALGKNCGGNFYYTEKGVKSCINCSFPHKRENYESMKAKIKELL